MMFFCWLETLFVGILAGSLFTLTAMVVSKSVFDRKSVIKKTFLIKAMDFIWTMTGLYLLTGLLKGVQGRFIPLRFLALFMSSTFMVYGLLIFVMLERFPVRGDLFVGVKDHNLIYLVFGSAGFVVSTFLIFLSNP